MSTTGIAGPTITPTRAITPTDAVNTTYDMRVGYQGSELSTVATIANMSTANLGLVLNTVYGPSSEATEVVTFKSSVPIKSISYPIYGWNRLSGYFVERLSFSQPVALNGTVLSPTTPGKGPFTRTADEPRPSTVTMTSSATPAFSTFQMTYSDGASTGQDLRIGIGDITVCT